MSKITIFASYSVARKGQVSSQISVRFPEGVMERIEKDIEKYSEHVSKSDFIVDAVKHYLDYRINQKHMELKINGAIEESQKVHQTKEKQEISSKRT